MIDLNPRMIDIVHHLEREGRLGERTKGPSARKGEIRFGSHGSLSIIVAGTGMGDWFDHEAQIGGGPWDLIKVKGGYDQRDVPDWLRRKLGIDIEKPPVARKIPQQRIAAAYDYVDEKGALLFQVVRYGPEKRFSQRAPDGKGNWLLTEPDKDGKRHYTRGDARLVPYHLDELVAARATGNGHPWRVYIVEGEKDADRLRKDWGVTATTSPGGGSTGKSKWRAEYNPYFSGSDAVVVADNDEAGRAHATAVAAELLPFAARVCVVKLSGLSEKGDISDWLDAGGTQGDLEDLVDGIETETAAPRRQGQIQIHDAGDIVVSEIPPRGWLLGTTFCRKFLSGSIGEGGVGKTAVRYAQYLASSSGRKLTDEHIHQRCRVLIVCLEDDLAEVQRRIGAAMLHHGVSPAEVKGWLFYCTPLGLKLLETDAQGVRAAGVLHEELQAIVEALKIDIVGIDPFVKAHGVDENDNSAIDAVCIMLAKLSAESDCAIDLTSHARKGAATPGDAERDRGASAKKDAGRLMRTLSGMTAVEAELFGVDAAQRLLLIRADDAKVNLTPRSPHAMWFELIGVPLGNGTERYPNGDNVQAAKRWYPPDAFAKLNTATVEQILNKIEAGPYEGGRYSAAPQAKDRAAWLVVQLFCPELNDKQAKHVINTWIKNGVLVKREYKNPKNSHDHPGLFVAKRPGHTWET